MSTGTLVVALRAPSTAVGLPVLMAGVGQDPVADGWVQSLARPGGNITGISFVVPTLPAKRLAVMKEIYPGATRFGLLNDATAPTDRLKRELEDAAREAGSELLTYDVKDMLAVEEAFRGFAVARIPAVHVLLGAFTPTKMAEISMVASRHGIATSWGTPEAVRRGGLLALGPDQIDLYRRVASYVDRILKGAKPGDLPVERPEKFELIVNIKVAQAIGVTIPDAVLAQATEVIR